MTFDEGKSREAKKNTLLRQVFFPHYLRRHMWGGELATRPRRFHDIADFSRAPNFGRDRSPKLQRGKKQEPHRIFGAGFSHFSFPPICRWNIPPANCGPISRFQSGRYRVRSNTLCTFLFSPSPITGKENRYFITPIRTRSSRQNFGTGKRNLTQTLSLPLFFCFPVSADPAKVKYISGEEKIDVDRIKEKTQLWARSSPSYLHDSGKTFVRGSRSFPIHNSCKVPISHSSFLASGKTERSVLRSPWGIVRSEFISRLHISHVWVSGCKASNK